MAFLVAPRGDLDSAVDAGIGVEHARGFERIDDAERAVEPAGMVLAFEMRAGQQLRPGLGAGAEHIADAVDRRPSSPASGNLRGQPLQRAHVRLGEGRLVHAGLVGADGTERIEIGENALAIGAGASVRHVRQPSTPRRGSLRPAAPSGWTNSGVVLIV